VAQWTGAHISKSSDPKTEFSGIDRLRTYIRTVPTSSLPGIFVLRRNPVQREAGGFEEYNRANVMRSILALGVLIAVSTSANAAKMHHLRSRDHVTIQLS
jgi:hypothetical protein